jgi:hypothetical protein
MLAIRTYLIFWSAIGVQALSANLPVIVDALVEIYA